MTDRILVTGSAGFIGYHLCKRLLEEGHTVDGVDCYTDYYDISLKRDRTAMLETSEQFCFSEIDLADDAAVDELFDFGSYKVVVNLAAQAGVRYSIKNPEVYIHSNVHGFFNVLKNCKSHGIEHFVFASSASVYGLNTSMPFSEHHGADHPMSLYAATKRFDELAAHSYAHLYGLPCTGLRFFSSYGPWGRPDMALFIFTKSILAGDHINVFNHGNMERDMTYVDDTVEGIVRVMDKVPAPDPNWDSSSPDIPTSSAPFRIYNIGNNNPVKLMDMIEVLEDCLGVISEKYYMDMQLGDIPSARASSNDLEAAVGFRPCTTIEHGVKKFVDWYLSYYR